MQCPNCGRHVRSKTQCAYCGYQFNSSDKKEFNREPVSERPDVKRDEIKEDKDFVRVAKKDQSSRSQEASSNTLEPDAPVASSKEEKPARRARVSVARRSLEAEMAQAEEEAKQAYQSGKGGEDQTPLSEEEAFKRRADEVFSYPYASDDEEIESDFDADEEILPSSRAGKGSCLGKLFKWLLAVAVIFALFMLAPKLYTKVKTMWSNHQAGQVKEISSTSEETSTQVEDQSTTQVKNAAFTLKDHKVDLTNYPTIQVTLDFDEDLDQVDQDTFKFKVTYNNTDLDLGEDYSLFKDGKQLKLSYVDPGLSLVDEVGDKQSLEITAKDFQETVNYDLPANRLDQQSKDQLNELITQAFDQEGKVSFLAQSDAKKAPYVYDNQTVAADQMISWFILQRTYELIASGELQTDQVVEMNQQLMASGDAGTVASQGVEAYTVQDLINLVIMESDPSAMNHLVQLAGGVNDFNYWLKEAGYFATRMDAPLGVEEESYITGALTNVTDIAKLLTKLAHKELVDEETDQALIEALGHANQANRFTSSIETDAPKIQLASWEYNPKNQHYAGIIQTEDQPIIVVILTTDFKQTETINQRIQSSLGQAVSLLLTGEVKETTAEVETTQAETTVTSYEAVQTTSSDQVRMTSENIQNPEPTDNLYEGKQTVNQYWFGDVYRRGTWYQGADGGWYYR